MSYTWDQIVAWLGLVVPLIAIAWSAVQYVQNQKREQEYREFQKFFEMMKELGSPASTLMGNVAIAYELRKFPQYSDVISRNLLDVKIGGTGTEILKREFAATVDFFEIENE